MQTKEYNIPDIGILTIRKNPRAKRIILRVLPDGKPILTIPYSMSFDKGFLFAEQKTVWLKSGIQRIKEKVGEPYRFVKGGVFETRFSKIKFEEYRGVGILSDKKDGYVYGFIPENIGLNSIEGQNMAKEFVINALKEEAQRHLPQRTKELAMKHGFSYKRVYVKNLKTRWGSCSGQNNINLNIHLMRLPEHLSDFIILHELCHTIHKNHGRGFHELLESLVGSEMALNKELNKHNINI